MTTAPPAPNTFDVLIVGAGMAGLAAARHLTTHGLRVAVLEARDRIGGRIHTAYVDGVPLELGAEFVHGGPPELLALIAEAGLTRTTRSGSFLTVTDGHLSADSDNDEDDDRTAAIEQLCRWAAAHPDAPDQSFAGWLATAAPTLSAADRTAAIGYVEGFNAADSTLISARALAVQQAAEDSLAGAGNSHIAEGYDRLPAFLAAELRHAGVPLHLDTPVTAIRWGVGRVALETPAGEFVAPRAILTLPLGVLQRGDVHIVPEPTSILAAARQMRMGDVSRVTLLFREPFWHADPTTRDLSFLFNPAELPGVWWTAHPEPVATLTGWVGGPRSRPLLDLSEAQLADLVLPQLAHTFSLPEPHLRQLLLATRSEPWSADPFARGAYSYVATGGIDASRRMAEPVEHTLFFAGEHTDTTGHWGTVHGALRSGLRAARQLLGDPA